MVRVVFQCIEHVWRGGEQRVRLVIEAEIASGDPVVPERDTGAHPCHLELYVQTRIVQDFFAYGDFGRI